MRNNKFKTGEKVEITNDIYITKGFVGEIVKTDNIGRVTVKLDQNNPWKEHHTEGFRPGLLLFDEKDLERVDK